MQGAILAGGQGGCFVRLAGPEGWVMLHHRDYPVTGRIARSPILVLAMALAF
jgi:hypothetical protein